jgi:hypothetical protein
MAAVAASCIQKHGDFAASNPNPHGLIYLKPKEFPNATPPLGLQVSQNYLKLEASAKNVSECNGKHDP